MADRVNEVLDEICTEAAVIRRSKERFLTKKEAQQILACMRTLKRIAWKTAEDRREGEACCKDSSN